MARAGVVWLEVEPWIAVAHWQSLDMRVAETNAACEQRFHGVTVSRQEPPALRDTSPAGSLGGTDRIGLPSLHRSGYASINAVFPGVDLEQFELRLREGAIDDVRWHDLHGSLRKVGDQIVVEVALGELPGLDCIEDDKTVLSHHALHLSQVAPYFDGRHEDQHVVGDDEVDRIVVQFPQRFAVDRHCGGA